ncbi:MAG: ABC transporter permease subunit, partial [Trichococcus flocculiformis]
MNSIRLEWKQERNGLFVWLFFMVLIMGLMMAMFPVMSNQGMEDILTTKLDAMPPEMLEAFSLTNGASLLQATGFFAYIFQYLFLAACIFATMKGAQALIKEETNGTIEYLYAQPISRKAIVTSKYIANLVLLLIFWIVLYGAALLFIYLFKEDGADFVDIIRDITLMFGAESWVFLFFF